jgi:hypothetical protein
MPPTQPAQDNKAKLGTMVDKPDLSDQDLVGGFVLLQVSIRLTKLLSLISPSSADLSWYTSEAALKCANIPLRTHIVLAQGIQHSKEQTLTLPHQRGLDTGINETFSKITEQILQDARAGSVTACVSILDSLLGVYALLHPEVPMTPEIEAGEEEYTPTEQSFRVLLRWMFRTTLDGLVNAKTASKLQNELKNLIKVVDGNSPSLSSSVISALCGGRIYAIQSSFEFGTNMPSDWETLKAAQPETSFLDVLVKNGFLNFKKSLKESVKSMMAEDAPFYEVCPI